MTDYISKIPSWVMMAPIAVLWVLTVALVCERFFFFARRKLHQSFFDVLGSLVREGFLRGDFVPATEYCREYRSPVSKALAGAFSVVEEVYQQWKSPDHDNVVPNKEWQQMIQQSLLRAVQISGSVQLVQLEKYIPALATIATIAPLFGLLGTVSGMLKAFAFLSEQAIEAMSAQYAAGVAGGITEALLTTFFGLVTAIPAYIFTNYFTGKVHRFSQEMDRGAFLFADIVIRSMIRSEKNVQPETKKENPTPSTNAAEDST